jgi:hypothetical protein
LRIYARLLQTQAQKFAASETMRTACSTEGCHRYRSKGILERIYQCPGTTGMTWKFQPPSAKDSWKRSATRYKIRKVELK